MSGFKYVRVMNIRKFCKYAKVSEYALGCNYGCVLNIPGFQVYQVSSYTSFARGSAYG